MKESRDTQSVLFWVPILSILVAFSGVISTSYLAYINSQQSRQLTIFQSVLDSKRGSYAKLSTNLLKMHESIHLSDDEVAKSSRDALEALFEIEPFLSESDRISITTNIERYQIVLEEHYLAVVRADGELSQKLSKIKMDLYSDIRKQLIIALFNNERQIMLGQNEPNN